jgi:hypothetical protein
MAASGGEIDWDEIEVGFAFKADYDGSWKNEVKITHHVPYIDLEGGLTPPKVLRGSRLKKSVKKLIFGNIISFQSLFSRKSYR